MSNSNFQAEALKSMTDFIAALQKDPESSKAYEAASAELVAFLDKHQFYGEAALMFAAMSLAQDEDEEEGEFDQAGEQL